MAKLRRLKTKDLISPALSSACHSQHARGRVDTVRAPWLLGRGI